MQRKRNKVIHKNFLRKDVITEKDLVGEHLSTVMIHLLFLFVLALLVFPIICFFYFDRFIFFTSLFFTIVLVYNGRVLLDNLELIGLKKLFVSIKFLITSHKIQSIGLTIINILLLLNIGFMTLIPTNLILVIFFLSILTSHFLLKKSPNRYTISIVKVPLIINFIFVTNYYVSFRPIEETFVFNRNIEIVSSGRNVPIRRQLTSLISLPNSTYNEYYGIRVFMSIDKLKFASKITYTIKRGLFGIRVVSNYKFS